MPLTPGQRLGPYEVISPAGAGGMGEVYRATDTVLKRTVALKVLPASVADDAERLARFRREAELLAALNHPHIAGIHGVETADGANALVMEFVEGPTLADRLAGGPLPLDEVVPIATQIAEALEAAHDQGIVHRDLKPANIKVRADGTVKVLDFGLAKAMDPSAGSSANLANSPTMTSPAMTGMGVILGTAAYMSPEQAKGRAVDRRADIWAFGVVLYEMLTGRRAFEGEDVSDLLVAVLSKDVDLGALPPATPPATVTLIRRCLVRDPKNRLRDIGEARLALGAGFDADAGVAARSAEAPPPSRVRLFAWPIGAAVVAALAMWVVMRPAPVTMPQVEFSVPVPADAAARRGAGAGVALSPDGQWLVFVGDPQGQRSSRLYARRLDAVGVTELPGTDGGFAPFFSPDGRWLAFFTDTSLMRMPVAGGRPTPITEKGPYSRGAWMSDDTIILGTSLTAGSGTLGRVLASGGTATSLTTLGQGETLHQTPHRLPDGTHVLFSVHNETGARLAVADLESGTHRLLGLDGSDAHYVPGRLIFSRDGIVFQAPFELDRLSVTGPESSILPDVQVFEFGRGVSIAMLDVNESGTLAYLPIAESALGRVSWLDGSGVESPTGLEPARYQTVRVAPDGTRVVVGMMTPETRNRIRVIDTGRGLPLDLEAEGISPIWGAGDTIIFGGTRGNAVVGLGRVPADNSQPPSTVYDEAATRLDPQDWSPDGRLLLASSPRASNRGAVNRDLYVLEPGGTPRALLESDADEFNGRVSPDGRWLAYQSTAAGTTRVYVRPFDAPGGTQTVSGAGGHQPVWARDGRALYFLQDGAMMKATAQLSPFVLSAARELFRMPSPTLAFDVAPDGRFLVLFGPPSSADEIRVVMGWTPPTSSRP